MYRWLLFDLLIVLQWLAVVDSTVVNLNVSSVGYSYAADFDINGVTLSGIVSDVTTVSCLLSVAL